MASKNRAAPSDGAHYWVIEQTMARELGTLTGEAALCIIWQVPCQDFEALPPTELARYDPSGRAVSIHSSQSMRTLTSRFVPLRGTSWPTITTNAHAFRQWHHPFMAFGRRDPVTRVSTLNFTRAHKCVRVVRSTLTTRYITIFFFFQYVCATPFEMPCRSPSVTCCKRTNNSSHSTSVKTCVMLCEHSLWILFHSHKAPEIAPGFSGDRLWVFAEEGLRVLRVSWVRG